jgi:hypothetical protein
MMDQGMMDKGMCMKCKCPHHKAIPVLVILLGLTFLLHSLHVVGWYFVSITWPILLILAGIFKLGGKSCGCCSKGMCMTDKGTMGKGM